MPKQRRIWVDKEFHDLICQIRARSLAKGKRPPSAWKITRELVKKIKNNEEIIYDDFIRFEYR